MPSSTLRSIYATFVISEERIKLHTVSIFSLGQGNLVIFSFNKATQIVCFLNNLEFTHSEFFKEAYIV